MTYPVTGRMGVMSVPALGPAAADLPTGLELSRRYAAEVILPLLDARPGPGYAVALLGPGSEVLGLDTAQSRDHDWGPRLQVFTERPDEIEGLAAELGRRVPERFLGRPTTFALSHDPEPRLRVAVTTVESWARASTGAGAQGPANALDWLCLPWQRLAEQTAGAVFADRPGRLRAWRSALAWYPDDLWRLVLAAQWDRIGEEEPFVGRCLQVGDEAGAAVLTGRLVRDLWRLSLLLDRRWPPYAKWLGTVAGAAAGAAAPSGPAAHTAARPGGPAPDGFRAAVADALAGRDPASALPAAASALAARQNALGLAEALDPSPRPFHDRPFPVLGGSRFGSALRAAVGDPVLRALPPVGSIDQVVDAVPVLVDNSRCRAVMSQLLGRAGERGT